MSATPNHDPLPTAQPPAPYAGDEDPSKLDAGALFVLKSRGSWLHCGFHLTTSIVAPAILSLPMAFASLGWGAGVGCLLVAGIVTFYSYNLLSLVLEHHAQQSGSRILRFRDMAFHILGKKWARYYMGPIQFLVCYGAVIGNTLLGGQSMKMMYLIARPNGTLKLYEFVVFFGLFMLTMAQVPSFHSLRHVSMISLLLCLAYGACATIGSIHAGKSAEAPPKDYSLVGSGWNRIFGVFSAISIIGTTYGNGIIPEIQATIAPPIKGKMFKGLCLCYAVIATTFLNVSISGYWAFGNRSDGIIFANFIYGGNYLVSKWFLLVANAFTILQLSAVSTVYLQPTNEMLEGLFADPTKGQYSHRNVLPRLLTRSMSIVVSTILAAMLPFFGDINMVLGAFGFLPLDFVMPPLMYNITFRPKGALYWVNTSIALFFSALSIVGAVAAVRQIIADAESYKLFANI